MDNPSDTSQTLRESTGLNEPREFYNSAQERGLDRRDGSKLIQLRKFHNWIKSTLISK